jgi:DNA-binding response OmpR family regulator
MVRTPKYRPPRVVIGHRDVGYASILGRQLAEVGWESVVAGSAAQARVLARGNRTVALLLDVDLPDESGWLTCDKVTRERPELCVVLMSNESRPEDRRFATFVGARAIVQADSRDPVAPGVFPACRQTAAV